jgi:hypothetical protein
MTSNSLKRTTEQVKQGGKRRNSLKWTTEQVKKRCTKVGQRGKRRERCTKLGRRGGRV